ncbi:MAG: hypothetical protein CVV64_12660 [Candidatus Wallbacteria bacterium HGW-Wallbacteria-1]|jgi:hypothetical protein|uniref:Uncharacterized protein n=1 Tax=Candidatus Wallbacteria bacterium HGW-Wallbacteria-1 TaxID=2013854 RepID=A0A2N1PN77_9BACT|nr:MAG: hypothetical protein CVV64_12660 [Candidatus Wallbacteria bacterium HGW-Wallbacteria-1]
MKNEAEIITENDVKTENDYLSTSWNPYLCGVLLSLTLLGSYLILGTGLGASAGLARFGAWCELAIAPARTLSSEYFGNWGKSPLNYYLVFMFIGTFFGGLTGCAMAGNFSWRIEKGASCKPRMRLLLSLVGGILVGFASRLANGCTSGQALSGSGALLTGSMVFLICIFVGGYGAAWFFRRQWHD